MENGLNHFDVPSSIIFKHWYENENENAMLLISNVHKKYVHYFVATLSQYLESGSINAH